MNRHSTLHSLTLFAGVLLFSTSCSMSDDRDSWRSPETVRVSGADAWQVLSPLYGLVFASDIDDNSTHLLLRHGDLIGLDSGPGFIYRSSDGNSVRFESEESGGAISGSRVTLTVDNLEGWSWLEEASPDEMSELRLIYFENEIAPERIPLIQQLASCNSRLSWMIGDKSAIHQLLPLFDSEQLWFPDITLDEEHLNLIAGEKSLNTLSFSAEDLSDLRFLTELPELSTLYINNWSPEETGPLPDNLENLRSLYVVAGNISDLTVLGDQPRLEELTLVMIADDLADISSLIKYPDLKTLCLSYCDGFFDLSVLNELRNLRWLALPLQTTQSQFAEIVSIHPELIQLETTGCEQITDLSPVTDLVHLEILIVTSGAPVEPLYNMKHLKFLAVEIDNSPEVSASDQQMLKRLRDELPGTAVVTVTPFCLGSGWILLLLPLGLTAWWLAGSRRGRRWSVPFHG